MQGSGTRVGQRTVCWRDFKSDNIKEIGKDNDKTCRRIGIRIPNDTPFRALWYMVIYGYSIFHRRGRCEAFGKKQPRLGLGVMLYTALDRLNLNSHSLCQLPIVTNLFEVR